MLENWLALYAVIMNPGLSVEKALSNMGVNPQIKVNKNQKSGRKSTLDINIIMKMIEMREKNVPYKDIGKAFGISGNCAYERIKKYKKRLHIA